MRGLTSPLWPIRYKPLPDELLSCWIVRLAHGHGLKVQTFCNLIFGNRLQVWNRDVDRLGPQWLVEELSHRTGTSPEQAWDTTLRAYEGRIVRNIRISGISPWILVLKMYHRKRQGYGLQYCPLCLADDEVPYFRKQWRIAFATICPRHNCKLLDRCFACLYPIAFHRLDMSELGAIEVPPLSYCHHCGEDLRAATVTPASYFDEDIREYHSHLIRLLNDARGIEPRNLEDFEIMRHLCCLMTSSYKHARLREFTVDQIGVPDVSLIPGRIPLEAREVDERHFLMQLTIWLMADLKCRLTQAWRDGAIRYNVLLKDFEHAPSSFRKIVENFSDWRKRFESI